MNTYDFDRTIYVNDSSFDFFKYCLRNHSLCVLRTLPRIAVKSLGYLIKHCDLKELKECFFSFLNYLPDVDGSVESFWKQNRNGIANWYLDRKRADDVIISASPEFLLKPVSEWLGVELIATRMDKRTGRITGKNCHDSEKVIRFLEKHPCSVTEEFYSDSDNDIPMARFALRAFKVRRGAFCLWDTVREK